MKEVKVSILVPIYGVENFIGKCTHSLFGQTYRNIEYIFVDDCSPDRSVEVLKEVLLHYPNRQLQVKIVRHLTNRGLAAARNTALKHATGKYVLNVDSDDYLEYNTIELLCEKAESENADIVVFDSYIDYLKKRKKVCETFVEDKTEYVRLLLQMNISPSIWCRFLRRDLYLKSKIRAIEGVNQGEDLAVTPRLVYSADKIVKLNECLYNYVQYNNGSYTKNVTKKSFEDMIQVCSVLSDFFSKINNSCLYANSLLVLKLRVKIYLLKYIQREYLPEVSSLFLDVEKKTYSSLMSHEQLLLLLSKYKLYTVLRIYTYTGLLTKKYLHILFYC